MQNTLFIRVTGRVQGVYFRQSTLEKAREAGITGFVKNKPDGSVEITASGTEEQLELLKIWCHDGPDGAEVDKVEYSSQPHQPFDGFHIRR